MHENAAKWDIVNGKRVSAHIIVDDKFIPINRPCDWCGRTVEKGYIHETCQKEEASFYIDILG